MEAVAGAQKALALCAPNANHYFYFSHQHSSSIIERFAAAKNEHVELEEKLRSVMSELTHKRDAIERQLC